MATFRVVLTKNAARQLRRIERGNKKVYKQLENALQDLKKDPYGPNTAPLKGVPSDRRVRVGGYRILYSIERKELLVEVMRVGSRGDVYK